MDLKHKDSLDKKKLNRIYEDNKKSLDFLHEFISTFTDKISEINRDSLVKSYLDIRSISNWYHSINQLTHFKPTFFSVFDLVKKIVYSYRESISEKNIFIKYGHGEKLRAFSVVSEIRDILLIVFQGIIDDSKIDDTLIISCNRERSTVILAITIPTLVDMGRSENLSRMSKEYFVPKFKKPQIYLEMVQYYCKKNNVHVAINSNENGNIIDIKVYLSVE